MSSLLVGACALALGMVPPEVIVVRDWCGTARITGYSRFDFSPRTADGTSIYTDEAIAAASYDIPLGSYVEVDGLGTYRIADRGNFPTATWIDIATWSRQEAYQLTSVRRICVYQP
jgi:3D (Asp-Asp-Asp) domain-containing protein